MHRFALPLFASAALLFLAVPVGAHAETPDGALFTSRDGAPPTDAIFHF